MSALRKVYRTHGIKLRVLKFDQLLTAAQMAAIERAKLQVFPRVIKLIKNDANIVFVDEAVFTSNQVRARYWAKAGRQPLEVPKAKLGFKAVAVVAALDLRGKVVSLITREKSIDTEAFLEFMNKLCRKMRGKKTYVFLDNLRIHHTSAITRRAAENKQELVFNASYSSPFNPIERLWAIAKRQFILNCVTDTDFRSQAEISALVTKCVLEASAATLEKHIYDCLKQMEEAVFELRGVN